MTELQVFKTMLERAGIGHGMRDDHNPPGTAIQVETAVHGGFWVTEFAFDAVGRLTSVESYEGE